MEKPILLWDRSQCSEQVCTCHDDSSPPRFCTGCGCNVASPGHRNTLDALDRQSARIAELEAERIEILQERRDLRTRCIDIKRGAVSRIAELEGALLESLKAMDMAHARMDRVLTVGDWPDMCHHVAVVHSAAFLARRVLGEGGAS